MAESKICPCFSIVPNWNDQFIVAVSLATNSKRRSGSNFQVGCEQKHASGHTLTAHLQSGLEGPSVVELAIPKDEPILCVEGQLDRVMDVLLYMDEQDTIPSVSLYGSLLKACTKRKDLVQAKQVHAHLAQHGLESATFLGESVVNTLVKCGGLEDALQVFHRLRHRTAFSWTAVISGCVTAGQGDKALRMYRYMQEQGLEPNKYTLISLLKACVSLKDLRQGRRIHSEALKYGYEMDLFVGTGLVGMYAKCGSLVDAQDVFSRLSQRDGVSWTALLVAYVEQGQPEKALQLYRQMQEEGVRPNSRTFVSVVQACGMLAEKEEYAVLDGCLTKAKYLKQGKAIHADVRREGFESDVFIGSTLVTMYGKCGSIVDAQNVFNKLHQPGVVSWNSLLAAHTQQGLAEKTLDLYRQMLEQGVSPDNRTFVSALQACGLLAENETGLVDGQSLKVASLKKGAAIHADAQRTGYSSDVFVSNTLINMYGKCGSLVDAQNVFDGLSQRNVVSWTILLSTYLHHGEADRALGLYMQMTQEGLSPDDRTFVSALQACSILADEEVAVEVDGQLTKIASLRRGRAIHSDARKQGYESDVFVASALVSMYSKCGSLVDAEKVFYGLSKRDVVSWTAMLSAYSQQGQAEAALQLYIEMLDHGVSPNNRTFVSVLQACGMLAELEEDGLVNGQLTKVKSLEIGKEIHSDALSRGYGSDVFVGNTLVSMYGKCTSIMDAQRVFDRLTERDVVSWNALLAGYSQQGQLDKALEMYEQMWEEGVSPNDRTFVSALQAFGMLAEKEEDDIVHGHPVKVNCLEKSKAIHAGTLWKHYDADVFIGNTLVSVYGKCGSIVEAQKVFDMLSERHVVSWNAMLAVYTQQNDPEQTLHLYEQMQDEGLTLDDRTFVIALQACGMVAEKEPDVVVDGRSMKLKTLEKGKAIHATARMKGFDSDVFVGNTLVSMYGKCGSIVDAQCVFDGLSERNVVSWTAMLSAHAQQGQAQKALQLYEQMWKDGVSPDDVTLVCILQACSNTGVLDLCKQIHSILLSNRSDLSPLLANTLVHAYGKCGSMVDAQNVFDTLQRQSVVSWNALITGYACQGNSIASLRCYERMCVGGIMPDKVTFLSLLSVCTHAGLVDKGIKYFESMSRDHGITPQIEHYASVVDLLSRAGYFTKVEQLLLTMPMQPDLALWLCLLGACRKHGKIALGKHAFDCAVRLQPQHAAPYVLMSSIYADANLWDQAVEVKELRLTAGACKRLGQSWIEHEHEAHSFIVGDRKHPHQHPLYGMLRVVNFELEGRSNPCTRDILHASKVMPAEDFLRGSIICQNDLPRNISEMQE